jgi:hypothetical protein
MLTCVIFATVVAGVKNVCVCVVIMRSARDYAYTDSIIVTVL